MQGGEREERDRKAGIEERKGREGKGQEGKGRKGTKGKKRGGDPCVYL